MLRIAFATLALLSLFAATRAFSQDEAAAIPPGLRADVERAEARGAELYRHDQAAWHTTDALKDSVGPPPGPMRGWLTQAQDDRIAVRYFAKVGPDVVAFAEADLDLATNTAVRARRLEPVSPASAAELVQLRARDLAVKQEGLRCSGAINTVVLPGDDAIDVYVLSAWEGGSFVFGGHQRVRVSTDGERILHTYEHTRACVPGGGTPNGFEPMPVAMVTHLTSPTPNEFH